MDTTRKKQTLSLLDKLREDGKPLGRSAEEQVGEGEDPERDSDLVVPYSEEYLVEERKRRRGKKQMAEPGIDQPIDVTGKY